MPDNYISPEIYRLAKTYHLGEPTARYETVPRTIRHYHFSLYKTVIIIWFGLFALLCSILILQYVFTSDALQTDPGFVFGWPIFWILVLVWLIRDDINVTFQKTSLYLCQAGLLWFNEQDKNVAVIPWDKIEFVWLNIMPMYTDTPPEEQEVWYDWKYTFQLIDGKKFIFKGHYGILALSYTVDKEVTARLLPRAIATYNAGLPVSFGNIQVSRKGIQIGSTPIAWQNIFSIELEGDKIIVRLPDWEHWIGASKAATPNVCVLEALIRHFIAHEKNPVAVHVHTEPIFPARRHPGHKRRRHRHKL